MKKIKVLLIILLFFTSSIFQEVTINAQTNSNERVDLEISNARELREFSLKVNNGNTYEGKLIRLTNDIIFDNTINNFVSIGTFNGTFDGGGHSISGIDIIGDNGNDVGLFKAISSAGVVKNLRLINSNIESKPLAAINPLNFNLGSIAGYNTGQIINCQSDINIKGDFSEVAGNFHYSRSGKTGFSYIGGLVGYNDGIIINCSSKNTISGLAYHIGGISGYNNNNISNSYNLSNITIDPCPYGTLLGGIVGVNDERGIIQNCYNTGLLSIISSHEYNEAGIAYDNFGIIANSFCSELSAPQNICRSNGIEKNIKALGVSVMQEDSFVDTLNSNRGDNIDWLEWVKGDTYPSIISLYEVLFAKINNGVVKANHSMSKYGGSVTLTATPNKGYYISSVEINTQDGIKITPSKKDNKYSILMPDDNIIVTANFKKLQTTKISSTVGTNIILRWDKVNGATKYEIYRSTSNQTSGFKKIESTPKLIFINKDIVNGKTYYYKIRAVYNNGTLTTYSAYSKVEKIIK